MIKKHNTVVNDDQILIYYFIHRFLEIDKIHWSCRELQLARAKPELTLKCQILKSQVFIFNHQARQILTTACRHGLRLLYAMGHANIKFSFVERLVKNTRAIQ